MEVIRTGFGVAALAYFAFPALFPAVPERLLNVVPEANAFVAVAMAVASLAAILVGLSVSVWRRLRPVTDDRAVARTPSVLLALAAAWLLLVPLVLVSMFSLGGFPLPPVTICGILALGATGGLYFRAPRSQRGGIWIAWFGSGLVLSWGLSSVIGSLVLFGVMAGVSGSFETVASTARVVAGPMMWLAGWISAEMAWRRARQPLAIGVGVGALEWGLLS